jgi:hypothetical protein
MRTVIDWEGKRLAGNNGRKSVDAFAEPGKALRQRSLAAKPENGSAADESAAGYREFTVHPQRS